MDHYCFEMNKNLFNKICNPFHICMSTVYQKEFCGVITRITYKTLVILAIAQIKEECENIYLLTFFLTNRLVTAFLSLL